MKRTQILLSEDVHDALRARSYAERTSLGEQVRRALLVYLGRGQGRRIANRPIDSRDRPRVARGGRKSGRAD